VVSQDGCKVVRGHFKQADLEWLRLAGESSVDDVVSDDRRLKSGASTWRYLPLEHEGRPNPVLTKEFLELVREFAGPNASLRRRPFYKVSACGVYKDIAQEWHRDRDLGQTTVIVPLTNVTKDSPHTEVLPKTLSIRRGRDPRQDWLARLFLPIEKALHEPLRLFGAPGDVSLLKTNLLAHRVVIPKTGVEREAVFLSFSFSRSLNPRKSEFFNASEVRSALKKYPSLDERIYDITTEV